jgi:HEAT repeat protein
MDTRLNQLLDEYHSVLEAAGWPWSRHELTEALRAVEPARAVLALDCLEAWLKANPAMFVAASRHYLAGAENRCCRAAVNVLSLRSDLLLIGLCDPALPTAWELAQALQQVEPMLNVRLVRLADSKLISEKALNRLLDLVQKLPGQERISLQYVKLLRHESDHVRARAVRMIARTNQNAGWVSDRLNAEPDPRVRANLIEGLWETSSREKKAVFLKGTRDTNHRVVANALVGLCRMEDPEAPHRLREMAKHPSAEFRAAAAWAMGELRDSSFLDILTQIARTDQGGPCRNALRALMRIRKDQRIVA